MILDIVKVMEQLEAEGFHEMEEMGYSLRYDHTLLILRATSGGERYTLMIKLTTDDVTMEGTMHQVVVMNGVDLHRMFHMRVPFIEKPIPLWAALSAEGLQLTPDFDIDQDQMVMNVYEFLYEEEKTQNGWTYADIVATKNGLQDVDSGYISIKLLDYIADGRI